MSKKVNDTQNLRKIFNTTSQNALISDAFNIRKQFLPVFQGPWQCKVIHVISSGLQSVKSVIF